jgi:hypothetical protein
MSGCNAGFRVGAPDGDPRVVNEATVSRIKLSIPEGKPPQVVDPAGVGGSRARQAALAFPGPLC